MAIPPKTNQGLLTWWNTGQTARKVQTGCASQGSLRTGWRPITFVLTAFTLQLLQMKCSSSCVLWLRPDITERVYSLMLPRLAPNCYISLCHSFTFYLIKVCDERCRPQRQQVVGIFKDTKPKSVPKIYSYINYTCTADAVHMFKIRKQDSNDQKPSGYLYPAHYISH